MTRLIPRRGITLTFARSPNHKPPWYHGRIAMKHFDNRAPMGIRDDIHMHQSPDRVTASSGSGTVPFFALLRPSERRAAPRFELRRTLLIAAISILSSMSVALASPSSNLHRRHTSHAGEVGTVGRAQSFEPPRMIEVRPGWWISTYDCVTDEGQGRWRPCSAGGG